MARKSHSSMAFRLRKTKAALLVVAISSTGFLLLATDRWVSGLDFGTWNWLHVISLGDVGGSLLIAGAIGTLYEYSFRKDQVAMIDAELQQVVKQTIKEEIPAMRDAVIEGFAIHPEDLKRVANPELLDSIAANVMGLRLGDEQFAREIFTDIRDQAIRSAERWHDVEVRIRLSNALERSAGGTPLFDVTVEWEYTTVPSGSVRRFACVSDRAEYNELLLDVPATSPWFMTARPDMDAASREAYEFLELTVDGVRQQIRRTARRGGQTYTVLLDENARGGQAVRIRQVFRTVTPRWGHRMYFELPQPARNLSVSMDYTNTSIAHMGVIDAIATAKPAQVVRTPQKTPGRELTVEAQGWLMPKTGFTFTWTLDTELPRSDKRAGAA